MIRSLVRIALSIAAVATLQAQSPSPSPSPKPLRQLEYTFAVHDQATTETHDSGMVDASGGNGSGVNSNVEAGGRQGTITVDVLGVNADKALIVAIQEVVANDPRPHERFVCVVYVDRIACPGGGTQPTDAETILMGYLGRGFVDPAALDANKHWRHALDAGGANVASDYTLTENGDGKPVTIVGETKIVSHKNGVSSSTLETRASYDLTMSVPDTLHAVMTQRGDTTLQTTVDLTLTKDSFAPH